MHINEGTLRSSVISNHFLLLLAVNQVQLYYRGFLSEQEESEDTFKPLALFLWVLHLFKNTDQV